MSMGSVEALPTVQKFLAPDNPTDMAALAQMQMEEDTALVMYVTMAYILAVLKRILIWIVFIVFCIVMYKCFYTRGPPAADSIFSKFNLLTFAVADTKREDATAKSTFERGHFDCMDDVGTCIPAFLCMPIRWSDTMSVSGVHTFWFAFVIWSLFALVNCFMYCLPFFGIATCLIMLVLRQRLRAKLELPSWGFCTLFCDCCFICWCPCCAVAQEARATKVAWLNREVELTPADPLEVEVTVNVKISQS